MTIHSDSILIPPGMRSDDGCLLCSRVCRVREDGALISPYRGTEWTSYRMAANRFSDSGELRNEAGLHAVWRITGATPENPHMAVLHCLASGQVRVGNLGLRAEVMEVQEIVLHPDLSEVVLESVRLRYPECQVRRELKRKRMLMLTDSGSYGMTVNGLLHGRWVYPDGSVRRYRDGKKHGRWTYPDGRIERYRNDLPYGRWTWPDGRVGHYRDGWPHGRWIYPDGRIEHYRNGRQHGLWVYPDGRIERYRYGKKHGRWTYPDGCIGHYRNGKKHGRWVYPDGRIERYRYGKKHGRWTYPDGRIERYRDGKWHGRWTYPDGRIEIYDMGNLVKSTEPAVSPSEGYHEQP